MDNPPKQFLERCAYLSIWIFALGRTSPSTTVFFHLPCLEQLQISSWNLPLLVCHDCARITTTKSGSISIWPPRKNVSTALINLRNSPSTLNFHLVLFVCLFVFLLGPWHVPTHEWCRPPPQGLTTFLSCKAEGWWFDSFSRFRRNIRK